MSTQIVVNCFAAAVPVSSGWTAITVHWFSGAVLDPLSSTLYPSACSRLTVSCTEAELDGAGVASRPVSAKD